jgi:hypothetical protein
MTKRKSPCLLPLLPLLLLGLAACSNREGGSLPENGQSTAPAPASAPSPESVPVPAADASNAASSADTSNAGSASLGPISSHGEPVGAGSAGEAQGASIDFDLPSGWQSETPSSNMRVAQATIPGSAGPGTFAVFFFGPGGGGGVDANIQRWIGQMEPAPGTAPQPESFATAKGFKVTWIDVAGTIKPSTMGTGPTTEKPGSRLLGAVVEGPGGPWFFKATGPDTTVENSRDAFLEMLKGVRAK